MYMLSESNKQALTLLPSIKDDIVLQHNIGTIVSRILVDQVPYFKTAFADIVTWHIPHQYSVQMSAKSKVVSY